MQVTKRFYKIIVVAGFSLQTLAGTELHGQNKFPATVGKKIMPGAERLDISQMGGNRLILTSIPDSIRSVAGFANSALLVANSVRPTDRVPAYLIASGRSFASGEAIAITRRETSDWYTMMKSVRPLSASFYTDNFGFFCKKELQIEKATRIPFRFRLGSLAACNTIEGK